MLRRLVKPFSLRNYSSQSPGTTAEYEAKWTKFFEEAEDLFEVQRGLNNCFGYDMVPTAPVLESALKAARRHDDFATAQRILFGLREKMPKASVYAEYMQHLKPLCDELGLEQPEKFEAYE